MGAGDYCGCAATIVTVHELSSRRPDSLVPVGRVGHRDAIEDVGPQRRPKVNEASAAGERAFLNENQATTCSRSRAQLRLTSKGSLMPDSTQSSDGVITRPSSKSVAQTIDGLRRLIADRVGFQNSATGPDLGFYAARSYSLMRPPRTGRRLTRSWERSATG